MPLFLLVLLASIFVPPKPSRYVTDRAFVLKDANALNAKLANFERQTSDQILVYVDQHLPPNTTIEEMGSEAMRRWGVGQKGKDNGAILFVFTGDRKMRIEVGYGLEGSLTDAKAKWITSTVIKPEFQRGDFDRGINNGVDAMLATINGEAYRGNGATVAETERPRSEITDWIPKIFMLLLFIAFFPQVFLGLIFGYRLTLQQRPKLRRPLFVFLAGIPAVLVLAAVLIEISVAPAMGAAHAIGALMMLAM